MNAAERPVEMAQAGAGCGQLGPKEINHNLLHEAKPGVVDTLAMSKKLQPITLSAALLTAEQVAAQLGYQHPGSIKRMAQQGILPSIRLNARVLRFRPEDVARLVEAGLTTGKRGPA